MLIASLIDPCLQDVSLDHFEGKHLEIKGFLSKPVCKSQPVGCGPAPRREQREEGAGMLPFQASLLGSALDRGQRLSFHSSVTPTVPEHSSCHMYAQKIFIE